MKNKLLFLGLAENVVDAILESYDTYQQTIRIYSKPAGPAAYRKSIDEIEKLSKKLSDKIKQLTDFECQQLLYSGAGDIREFAKKLHFISSCCGFVKQKDVKGCFNKREPFLLSFAVEVKQILEHHDIKVKIYKENIFCDVMDILLDQKAGDKSFNLLRQIKQ